MSQRFWARLLVREESQGSSAWIDDLKGMRFCPCAGSSRIRACFGGRRQTRLEGQLEFDSMPQRAATAGSAMAAMAISRIESITRSG